MAPSTMTSKSGQATIEKPPHNLPPKTGASIDSSEVENSLGNEITNLAEEMEYPEGGFRAWATVFGAFLIQFCGFGYSTSYGVFQDYYTRVYLTKESASAISWIGGVNGFLVDASGLIIGRIYDRGHFHLLILGGSLLSSFSWFMLSLCKIDHFYQIFLAQGIGHGVGAGLMFVPSMAVVSHYFKKRRSLAMCIVAAGSSFGAVVHPIMLNNTLNGSLGFAGATRANAGLMTGMLIIACSLMQPRLSTPAKAPNILHSMKRFSRDVPYMLASLGILFFIVGFYYPLFYLQLYTIKLGLSKNFAFYVLVIMNGSNFIARIIAGFLAQPIGVINLLIIATGSCSVLIFAMLGLKSVASLVAFSIIYGLFAGTFITLMAPVVAVLTDDVSELGARMGITFAFCGSGALIGPPVDGALLSGDFVWLRPTIFSGIFGLCGFVCFLTVSYMKRGQVA